MGNWDNLSLTEKAAMMRVAVKNGITNLQDIKREYNEFAEGGDTNPGMTGMMKSKLATAAHFGNPTARRMTNYDARSYTWPGEYEYDNGIGELKRGNVFVGSYDNLVTPQIQDDGKGLIFVDDVWSPENDQRSYMQSLKFSNEKDARYFGEHYKEVAPMMNIYAGGGDKGNKPKFKKSNEAYYDYNSDTVFAPDSTGEYYYHELFHARPDTTYLQKISPLYSDLNDEKLTQMGADLPFVKRFEGDPGHFYSPEEIGARRAAASFMLKQAGVKSIDDAFLNEARKDELKYGNNFRDLLHMYSNENLLKLDLLGNQFTGGGNIYKKGGNKNDYSKSAFLQSLDQSLKENNRFSSNEFRRFFTELADMESGYRPTVTNSIGAKGYFQLMPSNRSASWSNPTQQFHEMYELVGNNLNYLNKHLTKKDWERASQLGIDTYGLLAGAHLGGVGNVVKALRGKGNAKDINGSSVMGYMTRFSQKGPSRPITVGDVSIPMVQDIPEFIPFNSQAFNTTLPTYQRPELTLEEPVVQETPVSPYSPEEIDRQERMDRLSAFSKILSFTNPYPQGDNSFLSTIGLLTGNTFSKGGKIYIKPSHRGRLTELKKRTGKSEAELYKTGGPAVRKMITFARNARKWKHGLGGNLYDGISEDTQQMYIAKPDVTYTVKQPAIFPIKPDLSTDAVLARTNKVYSNYSQAKDAPLTKFQETQRNVRRYFKDNILGIVPAGISNCTLTATQWIDPTNPIKNAASITHNPEKYNYSPIKEEEVLPGNLLITKHPKKESYHTMLVSGFTEEDGTYNFNGKKYKYKKGEPLLTYSRGGHDTSFITKDIPLSVYIKNSDGKTQQHFYKYNKNKTLLPEVVVTNK